MCAAAVLVVVSSAPESSTQLMVDILQSLMTLSPTKAG
jgi:hypothetical protein